MPVRLSSIARQTSVLSKNPSAGQRPGSAAKLKASRAIMASARSPAADTISRRAASLSSHDVQVVAEQRLGDEHGRGLVGVGSPEPGTGGDERQQSRSAQHPLLTQAGKIGAWGCGIITPLRTCDFRVH
jgi:hypothetical protein